MGSSTLKALSIMANAGGNYFGHIATETAKTKRQADMIAERERLQQAGWAHDAEVRDARDTSDAERLAEKREYDAGQLTEQRAYDKAQDEASAAPTKFSNVKRYNAAGNVVMLKEDTTTGNLYQNTDEGLVRLSPEQYNTLGTDKPVAGAGKMSEAERKYKMGATNAAAGLAQLEELEAGGYDPTSTAARIKDDLAGSTSATTFMSSKESQMYRAAGTKVMEAFLRAATGAAAPDAEVARYSQMLLPQAGEAPETAKMKRNLLKSSLAALQEAGGMSDEDRAAYVDSMVTAGSQKILGAPETSSSSHPDDIQDILNRQRPDPNRM